MWSFWMGLIFFGKVWEKEQIRKQQTPEEEEIEGKRGKEKRLHNPKYQISREQ